MAAGARLRRVVFVQSRDRWSSAPQRKQSVTGVGPLARVTLWGGVTRSETHLT